MIVISSVELPERVNIKAAYLIAVMVIELPPERVIYCGTTACGQDFTF